MEQSGPALGANRSGQDGSRKGSLSCHPQHSHDNYSTRIGLVPYSCFYIWSCDNCRRQGGMTILLEQCPECEHHRCEYCDVEVHKGFTHLLGGNSTITHDEPTKNSIRSASKPKHRSANPASPILDCTQDDSITIRSSEFLGLSTPQLDNKSISECIRRLPLESTADTFTPSSTFTHLPSSTQKSVGLSEILDYNECAESENELDNDDDEFNNDTSDDQARMANVMSALESYLFSVLRHDLELVARLIPGIHSQLQLGLGLGRVVYKMAPSHEPTGSSGSNGPMLASSTTPGNLSSDSQHSKDGREDDNPEDRREDGSSKRQRKDSDEGSVQRPGFACHFHKRYPERYCSLYDRNFRTCMGPGPPELRRMKIDHLKRVHRDRQEPDTLTAGINDNQWNKIEDVFKTKRGMSSSEKEKHDIDRWNEIWKILFPNDPQPPHPWDSNFKPSSAGDFVTDFNHHIRRYREEGLLSINESDRQHIEHAAILAFRSHANTSGQSGSSRSWLPQINDPENGYTEIFSAQMEHPQFPFNLFPDQHSHGSELLPGTFEGMDPPQFSQAGPMPQMSTTLGPLAMSADLTNLSFAGPYFPTTNSSHTRDMNFIANAGQLQLHLPQNQGSQNFFDDSNFPPIAIFDSMQEDLTPIDSNLDQVPYDNNFLTSSLESENERPEATREWKNKRDRNMGLDQP